MSFTESVSVSVDGKEITSVTTNRPRVELETIPTTIDGTVRGYDFEAKLKPGIDVEPARMSLDPYQGNQRTIRGNRLHMFHLEVPSRLRGKGLGSMMFNIYKQYALKAGYDFVSLRVGGGQDTKDFLVSKGVNEDNLFLNNFPGSDATSVVLTTQRNLREIKDLVGIAETAGAMDGVFVEQAFTDL